VEGQASEAETLLYSACLTEAANLPRKREKESITLLLIAYHAGLLPHQLVKQICPIL